MQKSEKRSLAGSEAESVAAQSATSVTRYDNNWNSQMDYSLKKSDKTEFFIEEQERIVEKFAKLGKLPFARRPAGIVKEFYSFYHHNTKQAHDVYLESYSGHQDGQDHVFTYGQMEGARRLLRNATMKPIADWYYTRSKKPKYIRDLYLVPTCFDLLVQIENRIRNPTPERTIDWSIKNASEDIVEFPLETAEDLKEDDLVTYRLSELYELADRLGDVTLTEAVHTVLDDACDIVNAYPPQSSSEESEDDVEPLRVLKEQPEWNQPKDEPQKKYIIPQRRPHPAPTERQKTEYRQVQLHFETLSVAKQAKALQRFLNLTLWAFSRDEQQLIISNAHQFYQLKLHNLRQWKESVYRLKPNSYRPPRQPATYEVGWMSGLKRSIRNRRRNAQKKSKAPLKSFGPKPEPMHWEQSEPQEPTPRAQGLAFGKEAPEETAKTGRELFQEFLQYRFPELTPHLKDVKYEQLVNVIEQIEAQLDIPLPKAQMDTTSALTQEQNTTFTDQRETTTDDGYITTQLEPNMKQVSMQEDQWHVRDILAKPIPFFRSQWTTSTDTGRIIGQWDLPGNALYGPHHNITATFTFWRGHPNIRIQLNGTKFHSGRLIAAFIPVFQLKEFDDKLYSVGNLTSLPHVILDAGFSNSGVLNLPFVHMNTYFNSVTTRPHQSLGRFVLAVFNKLGSATSSSQTISVTGWISYDRCELHQPCYAHPVAFPVKQSAPIPIEPTPHAQAAIEGLVKSVTPLIENLVPPTAGIGSISGGTSNCDKPTDPVEIARWVPNAVSGLAQGTGIDRSSRLSLQAGTYTIGEADLISTTKDDMNLLELAKIPTRVATLQWASSTPTGTALSSLPVVPTLVRFLVERGKISTYTPTLLAYVTRPFKFWRGGLRYKIQVIASQMHSGRLMIGYAPGLPYSQNFDRVSYLNTFTIDLQEQHETEFVIPYMAERPWLRCDKFFTHTIDDGQNYASPGRLFFYVLNPLVRPDSVATTIEVNVLVSAADDFEVAVPADLTAFIGVGTPIPVAQSLETQTTITTRTDQSTTTLTRGGGMLANSATSTLSENAMDMKTLLRRYYKVYSTQARKVTQNFYVSFNNTPSLSGVHKCYNNSDSVQMRTHLAHFSELFSFWRGSLRYKIVFTTQGSSDSPHAIVRVYHVPGANNFGSMTPTDLDKNTHAMLNALESYGTIVATSQIQNSLEFEIPFYTPFTQLRVLHSGIMSAQNSTGLIFIVVTFAQLNANTQYTLDLYQAAGDDFGLNYLRTCPKIQTVLRSEEQRHISDNWPFLYDKAPDVCDVPPTPNAMEKEEEEEEEEPQPEAQMWSSKNIPIIGQHVKATEEVGTAARSVSTVCDKATHLMQQAAKKIGLTGEEEEDDDPSLLTQTAQVAHSITDPLSAALTLVLDYLKQMPAMFNISLNFKPMDILLDVSHLYTAFVSFLNGDTLAKILAIVSIVGTIIKDLSIVMRNSIYHFVSKIIGNLNGTKQGNEVPVAQMETEQVTSFAAPLIATLTCVLGFIGFKSLPNDKETTDVIKALSEKLRLFNFSSLALANISSLWTKIKELFDWIIDKIIGFMNPGYLAQLKLQREFEEVETWAAFIDEVETQNYEDRIHYDEEYKKKIYRAVDTGNRYRMYLVNGKLGREANVIREYCRKIQEICVKCDNSKNALPFRHDPFCISMFGSTGVGKSGIITQLGYDLMDNLQYPKHNRWCSINCGEKFFNENYSQQTAVYFDDMSAFTSEEQYQSFFNLKSNTAYPLNMAFKKGEYFNSRFIFMTTNTPHPSPNFLTCIPALWRRRDLLIEADYIEELREQGMRGEYVMREDNSHARYRLVDPRVENSPITEWMNYEDLMVEITRKAAIFEERQNKKVRRDLTRAGYILPTAQHGPIPRKLNIDQILNDEYLSLFSPDIWEHMEYNTTLCSWIRSETMPEDVVEEYDIMLNSLENMHLPSMKTLQHKLNKYSYEPKTPKVLFAKVKGCLKDLKDYLREKVRGFLGSVPCLKDLVHSAVKLTGVYAVLRLLHKGASAVVHSCVCLGLNRLGYRCGLCGRWPKLEYCSDKEWVKSEWKKLRGADPYEEGYVMSLEEEFTIRRILTGEIQVGKKMSAGTQAAHAQIGPYNDVTAGSRVVRVMAQNDVKSEDDKKPKPPKCMAQMADKQTTDLIDGRFADCLYRLSYEGNVTRGAASVQSFAIGARMIVTMAHFFHGMHEGEYFSINHHGAWMKVEFEKDKLTALKGKDLVVYKMPLQFNLHKSNLMHFVSEKDLPYARKMSATLLTVSPNGRYVAHETVAEAVEEVQYLFEDQGLEGMIKVQKAWKYPIATKAGDCGGILVGHCSKISGKLLGFHVCGNGIHGWSALVTREMLDQFVRVYEGSALPPAKAQLGNIIPAGHFGRIGKSEKIFFQNDKTQIVETDIHGELSEPKTFPAVLSRNDPRLTKRINPLSLGIGKYANALMPFPIRHRRLVNEHMRAELHTFKLVREKPTLLSELEMVKGIPELENAFETLPMNTSPGWPYVNTRPKGESGKAYLFDINGYMNDSELISRFSIREQQAKKGERVESVWIDCLKDERRTLPKIESGATRVFTIAPVDLTLLTRKYCQDFVEAIKASRSFSHCKLGIDCQSLEWDELYNYLTSFSPLMVAGDFSRFDGTVHGELIEDYFDDVDYFYRAFGDWKPEDGFVRRVLADEICNTVQLAKDEFYMTHGGNPSGNQQTTPLNSRTNYRYMALAWLGITEQQEELHKLHSMASFANNVRVACYGDDNILAIKPEVIEWFNQITISQYLEPYGITYTNETKDGVTAYKKLADCTFLKQGFADHESIDRIKVPIMAEQTMMELLNWTRLAPDQDVLLKDNCNDCLRFAYFYGKDYFDSLRDRIVVALKKHSKNFQVMTYLDYHMWFLSTIRMLETSKHSTKDTWCMDSYCPPI